ncbi:MAG: hypothetical protein H6977_00970 [Gammaproteobacteria bacterium]|nr:hypothetical protein [Gammaproteobacteria bacterium]
MKALYTRLITPAVFGMALGCGLAAQATEEPAAMTESNGGSTPLRMDFLDAAYVPGFERVVVAGLHGMVGMLDVTADKALLTLAANAPKEDFTALARLSNDEVLLGSSTGHLYRYDGKEFTEVAELGEYNEPILDIAVDNGAVWVVGARGLVARSNDGEVFETLEIRDVTQPETAMPGGQPADWYFGVSNVDPDSVTINAMVGGEPAVADEDYTLYPDEGFLQIQNQFDMDPPPTVQFKFSPGPPFRLGDVSWNVVLAQGGKVTIAGEFGMILQTEDNGETWIRRDSEFVPHEPEPAYWLSGVENGDTLWLTGAAGVSQRSSDGGVTWIDNPKPGREGIFGVTLLDGQPVISGAVGLIGKLEGGQWKLADRTALKLLSWLKTPVAMPDGSVLVMGGRATAIRFAGSEFVRIPVEMQ